MRIISQNGEVDFPYEQFVVAIDATTKTSILAFPASVADDTYFNLAEYSTKEKAAKAMEMLRTEYGNYKQAKSSEYYFDFRKIAGCDDDSRYKHRVYLKNRTC